jgi:ketosteroid isomerase-like protein
MTPFLVAAFAAILVAAPGPVRTTPGDAARALVEAEHEFARRAGSTSTRDAFLAVLDDSGVVFRPTAVNGKRAFAAQAARPGVLAWEPEYAEVSAAGDLGYTTGPWEFHPAPERNLPTGYGHFISVWKKQDEGGWHVMADLGVTHGKPARGVEAFGRGRGPTLHPAGEPARGRANLAALDQALGRATRSRGVAGALAARAAAGVRFNTEGALPVLGVEAARAALDTLEGSLRFVPQGGGLAASRDLGYSFGLAERFATAASKTPADSSVYLHIWRRAPNGKWKLALAVWNPLRGE